MDQTFQIVVGKEDSNNISAIFQAADLNASGRGALQPSELFFLAEQLVSKRGEQFSAANLIDTSAQFFDLTHCSGFSGVANQIADKSQYSVWYVQFLGEGGGRIAALKLSYLSSIRDDAPSDMRRVKHPSKVSLANSENKRSLIAEAACQVIADKGFAAASMREIAAAAGMHVPTMYQYVHSKDEVLELVYNNAILRVRKNVADALNSDLEPLDKLLALVSSLIKGNFQMRKDAGVLNRELRSLSHEGRERVLAHYAEFMDEVAGIISNGMSSGRFREVNPNIIANVIDAVCDMWALRPFALSGVQEKEFVDEISHFITHGLFRKEVVPEI